MRHVYGTKPRKGQGPPFLKYRNKAFHGHLWDVDTGKTWITVNEIAWHFSQGTINGALIIAPKGMYHQWPDEWEKHATQHIQENTFGYLWENKRTQKNIKIQRHVCKMKGQVIVIMNAEALSSIKGRTFAEKFVKSRQGCYMALDESSMFRNHKSKRTKAVLKIGPWCRFRRLLTGTFIANSPLDAFPQMKFLSPSILGPNHGSNYFVFRQHYAVLKPMHVGQRVFDTVVGYRNLEELQKKIAPYVDYMEANKDIGYKVWETELSKEQWQAYLNMTTSFVLEFKDNLLTAPMRLQQDQILRQISAGFVYLQNEDGPLTRRDARNVHMFKDNARINDLMELLSIIDGKVIIWADYRASIGMIADKLDMSLEHGKTSYVTYTGGDSDKKERQRRFNEDKDCRFFLATPQTGKFGLNLFPALHMVFYTTSYDYEARVQCEGRMRERNKKLVVWDIVARGTLEEKIRKALIKKDKMSSVVLGKEWTEWLIELVG